MQQRQDKRPSRGFSDFSKTAWKIYRVTVAEGSKSIVLKLPSANSEMWQLEESIHQSIFSKRKHSWKSSRGSSLLTTPNLTIVGREKFQGRRRPQSMRR